MTNKNEHATEEAGIDLSEVLDTSHQNKWVALTPDHSQVIASADTLRELMQQTDNPEAVYHRVLPSDVVFAPISA